MLRCVQAALAAVLLAALVVAAPLPDRDRPASPAAARPTPPAPATSGGVVVVAAGDIACAPGWPPTPAGCQQRATARTSAAGPRPGSGPGTPSGSAPGTWSR
jgi:hypothetical protein